MGYGLDDLTKLDIPFIPKQIRNIKNTKVHPRYQWKEAYYDAMIIEVDKEVSFTSTIYPVCIPNKRKLNKNHLSEKSVTIVGFGPENDDSRTMKQINQKVRSYEFCDTRYKNKVRNADVKTRQTLLKELPDGFKETLICAQNR